MAKICLNIDYFKIVFTKSVFPKSIFPKSVSAKPIFQMPAEKNWLVDRHLEDNHSLVIQCQIFDRKVHGAITDYVDDVYNKILVESNTAAEAKKEWEDSNASLDKFLAESGYKQNTKKQVVMPALRDMKENKKLYNMLPCEVKPTARYLGPLVSAVPSLN